LEIRFQKNSKKKKIVVIPGLRWMSCNFHRMKNLTEPIVDEGLSTLLNEIKE
jgi:hypothetical protein